MIDLDLNKERFTQLFNKYITREGSEKLLKWLTDSDFFTAPASSKFHNAVTGGLCDHSLNVFDRAVELIDNENKKDGSPFKNITMENVAVATLLHDVCKVNFYEVQLRNVKVDGIWEQVPYYSVNDSLPYGHGEKSVYIISGFMRLTRDEAMAINWHMGGFDKRVVGGDFSLSKAFSDYPFATIVHIADIMATYFDE
ncbi:MAG: HD domain-containing protein [Clostridia bacterium]|nr:HD domain-containing protein [Clostridia bacterium]MDE6758607.1 HD domain-containing protein [Clostridia bacterium]